MRPTYLPTYKENKKPWDDSHACRFGQKAEIGQVLTVFILQGRPKAWGIHSITSSARASNVGGTSRSGAFAVLTLRAVTNLVAMGEDYDISVRGGRRVSGTWLAIQART
jgi:hypothetical protein